MVNMVSVFSKFPPKQLGPLVPNLNCFLFPSFFTLAMFAPWISTSHELAG